VAKFIGAQEEDDGRPVRCLGDGLSSQPTVTDDNAKVAGKVWTTIAGGLDHTPVQVVIKGGLSKIPRVSSACELSSSGQPEFSYPGGLCRPVATSVLPRAGSACELASLNMSSTTPRVGPACELANLATPKLIHNGQRDGSSRRVSRSTAQVSRHQRRSTNGDPLSGDGDLNSSIHSVRLQLPGSVRRSNPHHLSRLGSA
jgi:hypothetical protein